MKILHSLGSGIFLAVLMPTVFSELTKTIIVFLQSAREAFTAAGILASYAGHLPVPPP